MRLDRVRKLVPEGVAAQFDTLWARFQREGGNDADAFVGWLAQKKHITSAQMRDILLAGDVAFTLSEAGGVNTNAVQRVDSLGLLGKGAMGEVHIARDRILNRNVALKRMDPSLLQHEELVERFYTEAQITGQLDHPGIVAVHTLEKDADGTLSYTMKLVRGKTLTEYLHDTRLFYDRGQEPDEDHALAARLGVFLQVCSAMAYAHSRGVIHRDLKPDNIMVGAFDEVLVMDWGIAKVVGVPDDFGKLEVDENKIHATQLGLAVGTVPYMSPEQAKGENDQLTPASDQYALGLILQEVVTLKRARSNAGTIAMLFQAGEGSRDPIVPYNAKIHLPRELVAIIAKATAREVKDRYADVDAFADDVRRYLRDEEVVAAPDSGFGRLKRWVGRNRGTTLAILASVVLVAVLVGVVLVGSGLVAYEMERTRSAARQERLADAMSAVGNQARKLDTELLRLQGLVVGLATAAEEVLSVPAPAGKYYTNHDFDEGRGPPDLAYSKLYDAEISLDFGDITADSGLDTSPFEEKKHQLARLLPTLRRTLLRSRAEDLVARPKAQQDQLIRERGIPAVWTYVALEEGVMTGFPGTGGYPEDYKMRERPWYVLAKEGRGPRWGGIDVDESGMGLLVTCAMSIHDRDDKLLGIAALDITFGWLIDELLDPPIPGEAFLIDRDGKVVVRSTQKDKARDAETYETPAFHLAETRKEILADTDGGQAFEDGQLVLWNPLAVGGWTYAVVVPEAQLLGE